MAETKVLGGAALGAGIDEGSVRRAFREHDIDALAWDGGTVDLGPNYLGDRKLYQPRESTKRDLRIMLKHGVPNDTPTMVTTAGGSGSAWHVDVVCELVREIADEEDLGEFTMERIYTDVPDDLLTQKIQSDDVRVHDYDYELTATDVEETDECVGLVGPEPFMEAIERGADVIICGRAVDVAPYSAVPLLNGHDRAMSVHMAKLLECGAWAAVPPRGADPMLATITDDDHFDVVPPNPDRRCTERSVGLHTLYENTSPFTLHLPDTEIDTSETSYDQVGDRTVRVSGTTARPKDAYSVLIEGAARTGYRSIAVGGVRGPEIVAGIDELTAKTRGTVEEFEVAPDESYTLQFRKYGDDAVVMRGSEPVDDLPDDAEVVPRELGVVIDVVGETQEIATNVCESAKVAFITHDFEGRVNPGGNFAVPYSPAVTEVGRVCEFTMHHLLDLDDHRPVCETESEVVA